MGYRLRRKRRRERDESFAPALHEEPVQTKLEIGKADDIYEREADTVADKVVMMPNSPSDIHMKPALRSPDINMKCAECEKEDKVQMKSTEEEEKVQMKSTEEEEKVQMKSEEEEKVRMKSEEEEKVRMKSEEEEKVQMSKEDEEGKVQMKREAPAIQTAPDGRTYASSDFSNDLGSREGQGTPLPDRVNEDLGGKIGADFSNVRIHTDSHAINMSREIGAQAFTSGKDIYFNSDKYNPSTRQGKHLLAHELTHVVQQGSADRVQRRMGDEHDLTAPRFSGETTLEAVYDDERYIRAGSRGDHVSRVQQALVDIGYELPRFGADGIFGNETLAAVKTFQRDVGLQIDGIVGPRTLGTLDDIHTVQFDDTGLIEDDGDALVMDGDSSQGATFPVGEHSLNILAQSGENQASELIQAAPLKPPPKKIAKPPEIDAVTIDLTTQKLKVKWSDKRETGPYSISSGKGCPNTKGDPCKGAKRSDQDTYCTPAGSNFKVEGLGGKDYKNSDGDAMSWYVAFVASRGIGIHNAQPVTGTPKSHGCVRVSESVAKMIHNNVTNKTDIIVTGDAPTSKWKLSKDKTLKGYEGCPLPPEKKKDKKKKK